MEAFIETEDGAIYGRVDENGKVVPFIITQIEEQVKEFNKRVDNPNPKLRGIFTDHGEMH